MNVLFQIALGLCPLVITFLIMTIISIKKKNQDKVSNICFLSVSGVVAIGLAIGGIFMASANGGLLSGKEMSTSLDLVYSVANEGDCEYALEILDSVREKSADSSEIAQCAGYIYAMNGDAVTAKAMFVKANMSNKIDNFDKLIELCNNTIAQQTSGQTTGDSKALKELTDYAADEIKKMAKKGKVEDAGEILIESQKLYDDFLNSDNLDEEKAKSLAKKIDAVYKENPALEKLEQLRVCKAKLLALAGDYQALAQILDENATFGELAIVAELYINEMINESDFAEEYGKEFIKIAKAVAKQLERVRKKISAEEVQKLKNLDFLVESLNKVSKNPAISRLKAELLAIANDLNSLDRPKAFMQLARIEYKDGNEELAENYITSALSTVGVSDDENFYTPMYGIVDSIADKDDIEKVKSIAEFAEEVTRNSSDYIVYKALEEYGANHRPDDDDEDDEDEEDEERSPFETFFADTATQKRNAFSITSVDATNFKQVQVVLNVDPSISVTAEELKKLITVKDCGVEISNYTIKKVEYSGANILLCCDVSGSMGGNPIQDLRNAVKTFVDSSSDIEQIALVPFSGSVGNVYPFGTDKDVIAEAGANLNSGGGTEIYGATLESIEMFYPKTNELNFILLMSDGDDSGPTNEQIQENIGAVCKQKGIVIYSLALGSDANADYLNRIASSTGGYCIYVNNSATLDDFYTKLRSQILNRYIITYNAEDTLRASREVTISTNDTSESGILSDTKQYMMYGKDTDAEQTEGENTVIAYENLSVSGLDTRRVFKSNQAMTVNLLGTNFKKDMSISIKLDGKLDYTISHEFVNANTIKLTLPGSMACGTYDLIVTIDGKKGIFVNELTVSAKGTEKTLTFGNYVFTADTRVDSENKIVLSGAVTMNGWLHFSGDVEFNGSLDDYSLQVKDYSGSYVRYDANSSTGLANLFAKNNISVPMAPLGTFNIYNDTYEDGESSSHKVDKIPIPLMYFKTVATFEAPSIELYPNMIKISSEGFSTKFPLQDKIITGSYNDPLFKFDADATIYLTNKSIDTKIDVSRNYTDDEKKVYTPVNFGNTPIYRSPIGYSISLDTLKCEFKVDLSVKLAFVDGDGMKLSLNWGKRTSDSGLEVLVPKSVNFEAGAVAKIPATIAGVPVEFTDFKVGIDDIDPNKSLFDWKLTGSFDLHTTKISSLFPGLEKYVKDPEMVKLNDTTISLSFGQKFFSISTELQVLDAITLGKLSLVAGNFPYTNELLDMYSVDATGIKGQLTAGIMWKTDNVNVDISGTGILNLHSKFIGVECQGKLDVSIEWWIFEKGFYEEGRFLVGVINNNGQTTFVVKARETTNKGSKEIYLYANSDDIDIGSKKL